MALACDPSVRPFVSKACHVIRSLSDCCGQLLYIARHSTHTHKMPKLVDTGILFLSSGDKSIRYGDGENVGEVKNVSCIQPVFSLDQEGLKDINLARCKMKQILREQKKNNQRVAQAIEQTMKVLNARKIRDGCSLEIQEPIGNNSLPHRQLRRGGIPELSPTGLTKRNGPIVSKSKSGSGDCPKLPSITNSPLINSSSSFPRLNMTGAKLQRAELT